MARLHVRRAICFAPLAYAVLALAQDTPLVSTQRPALEKLARWVGVWEGTVRYRWTPESPVFESHSIESTQWSPNHNFLITDQRETMPDGSINTVAIITWDPAQKLYRVARISAGGETEQLTMTFEGGRPNNRLFSSHR